MPVGWFIALRFMWEQRTQNALIVSGVGAGIGVLVFISALIGGLQASLLERTTGAQAHIVVTPLELEGRPVLADDLRGEIAYLRRIERPVQRMNTLPEWRKLDRNISEVASVLATVPIAGGPALAVRGSTDRSVSVIGADPDRFDRVIAVKKRMAEGTYSVNGSDVVLGVDLAHDLGVAVGDRVRLKTARGDGQMFIVRGLVDMGNQGLNKTWALMSLRNAQTLLELGGAATAVYAKVTDLYEADVAANRIAKLTGLTSKSWMETNAQLLSALKSQTASTRMIRGFVLLTVAISIASVLVVSVIQRSKEIGILRAMGFTRAGILRVFLLQGALIGTLGSAIGCGLGALLSLLFQSALRNADGSPLFPFALTPGLFASAAGIALGAGVVAAMLPARRASRLDPAEAMRHG
ncbi:MAG: ABC transporter permease [Polyangiaceae bacterium]|nr:ABC transporter permease [Polyangiaceae bacterium]